MCDKFDGFSRDNGIICEPKKNQNCKKREKERSNKYKSMLKKG